MKPDCTEIELQLVDYAAGTAPAVKQVLIESHLAECPSCRDELAREVELRSALAAMPAAACPDGLSRAIATAAVQPPAGPRWAMGLGLVAALLAFILLVPGQLDNYATTATGASGRAELNRFSAEEIAQARRNLLLTFAITADILDRSSDRTMAEVFGRDLPRAVTGSLRNLDPEPLNPATLDASHQSDKITPNPTPTGGQG